MVVMVYRPLWGSVCCLLGLVLAACSEQPQQESSSTTAFAANSTNNCAPTVFNSLIAGYFTNPQQQKVSDYKTAMLNARAAGQVATARTNGFHIMREIAAKAKTLPQPPAAVGSELTVETLKCIFVVTDTLVIASPPSATYFEHALDRAAGGGYDVRGKPADPPADPGDPTGTVQAVKSGSLTATAALAPSGGSTWDAILSDDATLNPPNARVLIYGEPILGGADPLDPPGYDWSSIPRDAFFAPPGVIVTTCHDDIGQPTEMLTETFGTSSGVLAWVDATSLCSVSASALDQRQGVFALFGRLARLGGDWLVPQTLAAAVVSPGLTGGNAGSIKSIFDVAAVPSVTLAFRDQPQNTFVNQPIPPPVTVTATSSEGPVAGVEVTLVLVNNNGNKVVPSNNVASTKIELVSGQPVAIARFTGMSTNKAGGYAVQIDPSSNVTGRPAVGVNIPVPTSNKFNVKPAK
jgi:hypothetical protein